MSLSHSAGGKAIALRGVSRRFGPVTALSGIDVAFEPGLIHALVGQNGAGKSTCLGIIAGRIAATDGEVIVNGTRWPDGITPAIARRAGVATIYQELTVLPAMTALDNVFLGNLNPRFGLVPQRDLRRRFAELSAWLGVDIDPAARAGDLSIAHQQMIEIMRALSVDCRVLLLDEPTAALSDNERRALFRVMADLKARGVTLIFVSHYLDEVEANSDTVTVFRDGRLIETAPAASWTRPRMIEAMLGNELEVLGSVSTQHAALARTEGVTEPERQAERLRVEGLTSRGGVHDIGLSLRSGEIVGLAGLVGSGRTSLINALSGVAGRVSGRMWIDGQPVDPPRTPRAAWSKGIALIPEDRKASGLFMAMSSRENMMIADLGRISRFGMVRRRQFRGRSDALGSEYGASDGILDRPAGHLSGGNQQKLLLARAAHCGPRILLADEPTRGIDVGAKAVVLRTLRRLAGTGMAILFVSSDLEEVAALSDRVYVLREGRVVAQFDGEVPITENAILDAAFVEGEPTHV